jgi:hypothetical protein
MKNGSQPSASANSSPAARHQRRRRVRRSLEDPLVRHVTGLQRLRKSRVCGCLLHQQNYGVSCNGAAYGFVVSSTNIPSNGNAHFYSQWVSTTCPVYNVAVEV